MSGRTLARPRRLGSLPLQLPPLRTFVRRMILLLVLALALAAGYVFWLRDSSLVAVERVTVTGAESEPQVVSTLTAAAEGMSTLDIDHEALDAAVAAEPSVLSVSASTDFPHGLEIDVETRVPAAFVAEGGLIVAGDGVVLEANADQPDGVPAIMAEAPEAVEPGARLEGGGLTLARIMADVPEPLVGHLTGATIDAEHGPVVDIGPGIELRFGDPAQAARKWEAAAAVLADPSLRRAIYIDLAVPGRPVVG